MLVKGVQARRKVADEGDVGLLRTLEIAVTAFQVDVDAIEPEALGFGDERLDEFRRMIGEAGLGEGPVPGVDAVVNAEQGADAVPVRPVAEFDDRGVADAAIFGRLLHAAGAGGNPELQGEMGEGILGAEALDVFAQAGAALVDAVRGDPGHHHARGRRLGVRHGGEGKAEHPTSNAQHPTSNDASAVRGVSLIGYWMFDVGGWMFSRHFHFTRGQERRTRGAARVAKGSIVDRLRVARP